MSILVVAEHDNAHLKDATLNTVAAANAIGGDINILVAGAGCSAVADQAAAGQDPAAACASLYNIVTHIQNTRHIPRHTRSVSFACYRSAPTQDRWHAGQRFPTCPDLS